MAKSGEIDLSYTDCEELFFLQSSEEKSLSKSQKTRIKILEAAIGLYASVGIDKVSYELVAERAGVSWQLVQHYFKDKRSLFSLAVKYTQLRLQKAAIRAVEEKGSRKKRFKRFLEAIYAVSRDHPEFTSVALLNNYYCSIDPESKARNTEVADLSLKRILSLIEENFRSSEKAFRAAQAIQTLLFGGLDYPHIFTVQGKVDDYRENLLKVCLTLARF